MRKSTLYACFHRTLKISEVFRMEKIYTIPVNEAFDASAADKSCGCPFCTLYNGL